MPRPSTQEPVAPLVPDGQLPHPAEDLSEDDDLLSWILVDQLGILPGEKGLGVHPQQVKFVGPPFRHDDVLNIVKQTVVQGNLQQAVERLSEFHLIKEHMAAKQTDRQRERVVQHLRRYLMIYAPTSRLDIYSTDRYTSVSGHPELAIFATSALQPGAVVQELQGSVVPLPDAWKEEMDIVDDIAAPEIQGEEDLDEDEGESRASQGKRSKTAELSQPRIQRRSGRIKRRDFSIVWSGLKQCYQLFLGPARFLNHDCKPNVELLRQGKFVTFRVVRPIRIGDELTTFYGENYFGNNNIECMCLSCERSNIGWFTPKDSSTGSRSGSTAPTPLGMNGGDADDEADPSRPPTPLTTPRKVRSAFGDSCDSPASATNGDASDEDDDTYRRTRPIREARLLSKPLQWLKRPRKGLPTADPQHETYEDEDWTNDSLQRCITCAKTLRDQVWWNGRWFDHCSRCIRHALIFLLPWPAHRPADVRVYPPPHLTPPHYVPKRVADVPIPSLSRTSKKSKSTEAGVIESHESHPHEEGIPDNSDLRRERRMRRDLDNEQYTITNLRVLAWEAEVRKQEAEELAAAAKAAALAKRQEDKRLRDEEKRKRNEGKIRGTGLWTRYEMITEEELERRQREKHTIVSGTRRGRKYRNNSDDEEIERLAQEKVLKDKAKEKEAQAKAREYRIKDKEKRDKAKAREKRRSRQMAESSESDAEAPASPIVMDSPDSPVVAPVAGPSSARSAKGPATPAIRSQPPSASPSVRSQKPVISPTSRPQKLSSSPAARLNKANGVQRAVVPPAVRLARASQDIIDLTQSTDDEDIQVISDGFLLSSKQADRRHDSDSSAKRPRGRPKGSGSRQKLRRRQEERDREQRHGASMASEDEASPKAQSSVITSPESFDTDDVILVKLPSRSAITATASSSVVSVKRKRESEDGHVSLVSSIATTASSNSSSSAAKRPRPARTFFARANNHLQALLERTRVSASLSSLPLDSDPK